MHDNSRLQGERPSDVSRREVAETYQKSGEICLTVGDRIPGRSTVRAGATQVGR